VAEQFSASTPSPARIWNYWVGGKDNFQADRDAANAIREVVPYVGSVARLTRQFLIRAVTLLASEYGVRQFIDIGSGLPTARNTHEVAQDAAPQARIVYVDNDPQVIMHARTLLKGTAEGSVGYLQADLRDTTTILAEAARELDLSLPVAVLLVQVLHFIPDSDEPHAVVRRLMAPLAPGSFLVLVHGASDIQSEVSTRTSQRYNAMSPAQMTLRGRQQVARFFDGLAPMDPGLVSGTEWLTPEEAGQTDGISFGYNGIARKP
jgi:SAM-dependent methyltransferase